MIDATRQAILATGKPYVIENVPQAPLINPVMLCGTMFGLRVIRHRHFEMSLPIWFTPCCNHWGKMPPARGHYHTLDKYDMITVAGHQYNRSDGMIAMDISHYMTRDELSEAIPPAYTEFIGKHLLAVLQ